LDSLLLSINLIIYRAVLRSPKGFLKDGINIGYLMLS